MIALSVKRADRIERAIVAAMYAWFTFGIVSNVLATGHILNLLILVAESLTLALILLRKPADAISRNPSDWVFAFCGTLLPLLARPGEAAPIGPAALGGALIALSILAQLASKLSLGRCFGIVPAKREVVTHGAYRLVRHPIYASYLIAHVGFCLLNPTAWNVGVYVLAFGFQVLRILREEALLNTSESYRAYTSVVRHRLLPGVF